MGASDSPVPGLPQRFRVDGPLGRGGQAQTFAATDTESGEPVVIKVFRLAGSEAWKRFDLFERECAVLRSLEHPAVPRYVEHGGDEDAGVFYLVMQRAGVETLQALIDRGRRFTDGELHSILDGVLEALAYLHALNPPVIHRDVKPGNILIDDDRVWLVDFGSVRDAVVDDRQSTVVGTVGYMAPEQLRGRSSAASDLYGLGATVAAAATGMDAGALPSRGLEVDLSTVIKAGPLRDLLQWMVRADPDARPSSVAELRAGQQPGRRALEPAGDSLDRAGAALVRTRPQHGELRARERSSDGLRPRDYRFVAPVLGVVGVAAGVASGSAVMALLAMVSAWVPIHLGAQFFAGVRRGLERDD